MAAVPPAFLTDPRITATIVYWVARNVHPTAAAKKAGVAERDFSDWLEKGRAGKEPYTAFAAEIDAALVDFEMMLSGVVHEAVTNIQRPDVSSAKWILERRFPKNWRAPKEETAPLVPVKTDGKAYSVEELRSAADLVEAAASRAKARIEAERKNAS